VFENRVLTGTFGLETGETCILRSFIICTAHVIKWRGLVGRVARMEKRNAYRDLGRKPKEKSLLGTPKSRRQDNAKMYLKEIRLQVVVKVYVDRDRNKCRAAVNTVRNLRRICLPVE
jgi:hypothetical protein